MHINAYMQDSYIACIHYTSMYIASWNLQEKTTWFSWHTPLPLSIHCTRSKDCFCPTLLVITYYSDMD